MTEWITIQESSKLVNKDISVIRKARKKYGFKSKLSETGSWLVDKDDVLKHYQKNKYFFDKEEVEEFFDKVKEINKEDEDFLGDIHSRKAIKRPLPPKGESKYYLITAALNNTSVNEDFFKNLLAVKENFNAELLVSRLVYNKNGLNTAREKDSAVSDNDNQPRYANSLNAFLNDDYIELSNDLVYLGHVNRSITASTPLSSSQHQGWNKSFVLPHTKRALETYPVSYAKSTISKKVGYTTGVVTNMNYIQNFAGQKMELFHYFGACLVKVNDDGSSFVYQLSSSSDGNFSICLFDLTFIGGKILKNQTISGIVLGDSHNSKLPGTKVFEDFFGKNNIFSGLNIRKAVIHDSLDFSSRSHHTSKDYLTQFIQHHTNNSDVFTELKITVDIINEIKNIAEEIFIVESNHDCHLSLYLNGNWKLDDHVNKLTNLYLNFIQYAKACSDNNINNSLIEHCVYEPFVDTLKDLKTFDGDIYEFVARKMIGLKDNIKFVDHKKDVFIEDYLINLHGDKGTNGSRSTKSLKNISQKMIVGHSHTPSIQDFLTIVGYTGEKSKFDYATSPSSWAIAFSFIYSNGTSGLYFYSNGNFR